MTDTFSFAQLQPRLARAAQDGAADAAEQLAQDLRANGEQASVQTAPDGTARVVLEGAAAVQREFGTQNSPARPVIGAALQANRRGIDDTIARKLVQALRDTGS